MSRAISCTCHNFQTKAETFVYSPLVFDPSSEMAIKINPIKITTKAAEEVRKILLNKGIPEDYGLRVGIKGSIGGCGAREFYLGFDAPKEGDNSFDMHGIMVLINKKETMYLMGVEVDYHQSNVEQGFFFNTPEPLNQ